MTRWSIRLRARPGWSLDEAGRVELEDPSRGERVLMQPWTARVLEAVEREETPQGILDAATSHEQGPDERKVRHLLHALEGVGIVRIEAPAPDGFGAWRVERELGHGGVGIAYLVARGDERCVAKVPWDFLHPMETAERALRREADVLRALDSPAIVRLVELLEHDGHLVLVREHVDGTPLTARFEGKPATAAEAADVARGVAEAMEHAQARGLVLVDYKPSNFFLVDAGRTRLVDAGHAAPAGASRVGGTPGFMPPELLARGAATPACDVWGLGRLYAYLRAGRLPRPRDPNERMVAALPENARPIVERLCADEPSQRPATLAEALALIARAA